MKKGCTYIFFKIIILFRNMNLIFNFVILSQIEISHKNQVPMLMGPPPKSRSLFSFLTRELRQKVEDNFEDDPE